MSIDRSAYTAGLRALADALDENPDLPLPYYGTAPDGAKVTVYVHGGRDEMAAWARVLRNATKRYTNNDHFGFELHGALHGLHLAVIGKRDEVCTRRVVGKRTVVVEVPDPEALAAVPTTTVTRTEDIVEWDCGSLLAPVTA